MKTKEPNYPAILHFADGDSEYVVIANDGPIEDHKIHGYQYRGCVEIDDVGQLPTDQPLRA